MGDPLCVGKSDIDVWCANALAIGCNSSIHINTQRVDVGTWIYTYGPEGFQYIYIGSKYVLYSHTESLSMVRRHGCSGNRTHAPLGCKQLLGTDILVLRCIQLPEGVQELLGPQCSVGMGETFGAISTTYVPTWTVWDHDLGVKVCVIICKFNVGVLLAKPSAPPTDPSEIWLNALNPKP